MASGKGCGALLMLLMSSTSLTAFLDTSQDYSGLQPLPRNYDVPPSPHDHLDTKHRNDLKNSNIDRINVVDRDTPTQGKEYIQENIIHEANSASGQLATNFVWKELDDSASNKTQGNVLKAEEENASIRKININKTEDGVREKSTESSRPKDEDTFPDTNDTHPQWSDNALEYRDWASVKSKLLASIKMVSHQYDSLSLVFSGATSLIGYVDQIYYGQKILNTLEPSLSTFFYDQIIPIIKPLNFIFKYFSVIDDDNNLIVDRNNITKILASENVQVFITKAQNRIKDKLSVNGLREYYTALQLTQPMEAQALDFVLNLFPDSAQVESGRGLHTGNRYHSHELQKTGVNRRGHSFGYNGDSYTKSDRGYGRRDGGYGHSDGGYGHSGGGYGHMSGGYGHSGHYPMYYPFDPYLILAALGAATLLTYIAYRVLVTTTSTAASGGRRRRFLESPLDIEYTDLPYQTYSVNNMIESAAVKYKDEEDEIADIPHSLNSLWRTRQEEEGSVRSALKNRLESGKKHLSMSRILIAGAGQLMGAERAGHLLDELSAPVASLPPSAPVAPRRMGALVAPHPLNATVSQLDSVEKRPDISPASTKLT